MDNSRLETIINQALDLARRAGASAEATIGSGTGFAVTARLGEVETIEHQNDKGLNITVYEGTRKGSASTTDFSERAIQDTVSAAHAIARNAGDDPAAGLIDPRYLATEIPDLDLYHPWDLGPEDAVTLALECEDIARNYDPAISNSEGATVHTITVHTIMVTPMGSPGAGTGPLTRWIAV